MDEDLIRLNLDGAEAHVLEAALAIYRRELTAARDLGGPAQEVASLMDRPAARVQAKLHDLLYGGDEIPEPDWDMPESADEMTQAKALLFDGEGTWVPEDLAAGDHHFFPGVGR
jgi:hypothetical protein